MLDLTGTRSSSLSRPETRDPGNLSGRAAAGRREGPGDGQKKTNVVGASAAIPEYWISVPLMIVILACALYALMNP